MKLLLPIAILLLLFTGCARVRPAPLVVPPAPPNPVKAINAVNNSVKAAPKPDPVKTAAEVAEHAPKVNPSALLNTLKKLPALPSPADLLN